MILEPPKIRSDIVSIVSPSISHEVMGTRGEGGMNWEIGFNILISVAVVQSLSSVELFVTHGLQHTISQSLLKHQSLESMMPHYYI